MTENTAQIGHPDEDKALDDVARMLAPYRFHVCTTAETAGRAFEVRRLVYQRGCAYTVPIPDDIDERSWFLVAEEVDTGRIVGTMRATPRSHGPLELERYFRLPRGLRTPRSVELSRFAILPAYRKSNTSPAVSLGLFNLVKRFLDGVGTDYMLLASKAKRAYTYHWLRFTSTGIGTRYDGLGEEKHELMFMNLRKADLALEGHPLAAVLAGYPFDSVHVPERVPALGIGVERPQVAIGA